MTLENFIKELETQNISVNDFAMGNFPNPLPNLGPWSELKSGGGKGKGPKWYSVKSFPKIDLIIKTSGFYSSYLGLFCEDGYGVRVKEITKKITIFE